MKGIILAGGLAKRFRPLSHTGPKQLVPIANKPVLYYVVEDLVEAGIKDIGVVVSHIAENANAIKDTLGDGARWNCNITYIHQDAPRGLAHAIGICREFVAGDRFVVYLGDNILKEGIAHFVKDFCEVGSDADLLSAEVDDPGKYGILVLNKAGRLVDVEEKPQNPRSNLAIIGVYMFTSAIFEMIHLVRPGVGGEMQITDAIRRQYELGVEDAVLFFMGWLYSFSGLKEVASQLAVIENHNLKLLIVGDGDAYEELQKIQQKHNLKDRLILTGKRPYDEIPSLIAAADICLLPAYPDEKIMQDIVPIKLYKYMAMGKPVISTRLPGVVKEFGENNGVVYVDRPEDVIAGATELVQCGRVEGLGQKVRKYVERNSWDKITDEFEEIISIEGGIRSNG